MTDYNLDDAFAAIARQVSEPGLWISLAALVVAFTLLAITTPKRAETGRDRVVELCRVETNHNLDRAPRSPLPRGFWQRLPGLYSQQTCRCADRSRQRWIGTNDSARAQRLRNAGKI